MGIFPRDFSDRVNVLLQRQCLLSQPTALGLDVPDLTPNMTCARAHLKSVTCTKLLYGLEIIRMYDQYALGWFEVISASWALAC